MSQPLAEWIESWASGVLTTQEPDAIPKEASPRGHNSFLASAAGDRAAVQKRRGALIGNAIPITGSPAIIGQYGFHQRTSGSVFTRFHLLVSNLGRLDTLLADGTTAPADATSAGTITPFTSGDKLPCFTTANNLCFIVNGTENKKFTGALVQAVGVATPTVVPTIAVNASAGVHTGTYESRYTYYNQNTNQESSASGTSTPTVAPSSEQLNHTWTASADPQVTHVKLYIRNTTTMSTFRLAATTAIGTVAITTNLADSTLIIAGPDTAENNPPPVLKLVEFHAGRLFGVDAVNPSKLVYSKLETVEAFDPDFYELVADDDGDVITALHSVSDSLLLIFKRDAIWGLFGDDPTTWELKLITSSVGCTAHRSVVTVEGITYFWGEDGPMALIGTDEPVAIGKTLIDTTVHSDNLNHAMFGNVCAAVDPHRDTILWAVAEESPEGETSSRNHIILPYSYRLKRFHADRWDPLDVASLATIQDSDSIPWVYLGGYNGQTFKWWASDNDGLPATSTSSGAVTSEGVDSTTLTCSTAAFVTTGGSLVGRYVYAIDASGSGVQRRRIGSNTATVITLASGLTWAIKPNTTYTFVVGAPQFAWDTHWINYDLPFWKKRYQQVHLQFKAPAVATTVYVDMMRDLSTVLLSSHTMAVSAGGGVWDVSLWDDAMWGGTASQTERFRVGRTARALRVRVRNFQPDRPFTLLRLGVTAELLSDKS